jgi:hypothetical protein
MHATAMSLWSTGTVGAAIAFDRFEIAVIVAGLNFVALRVLFPIKETMENGDSFKDEKKVLKSRLPIPMPAIRKMIVFLLYLYCLKIDFLSVCCYCSILESILFPVRYDTLFIVATSVRL